MRQYFFNDGTAQQGPFTLEELKAKNILATTPVWYEGLDQWTTAGQVEELKDVIQQAPPVVQPTVPPVETKSEVTPVVPAPVVDTVVTPAAAASTAATATTVKATTNKPVASAKGKSTAWVSYLLALLIIGGAGYYIYQDLQKNKTASANIVTTDPVATAKTDTTGQPTVITTTATTDTMPVTTTMNNDTTATVVTTTDNTNIAPTNNPTTNPTNNPTTNPTNNPTTNTVATTNTKDADALKKAEDAKKKLIAQKKIDDDKKKKLALEAQKKEDEKKKMLLAQAAREAEMRNNWPRYVTIGGFDYKDGDNVKAFAIPVYNGTTAVLDKVTLRVDYIKKEGKVVGTETLVAYNVPVKSGMTVQAPGSKKAKKVNVYIVGITSHGLHFCYPANNGNQADPYFCN
jgi:hypothetical protein